MATGNFIYSHDDLVTGEASFPKGLGFQKIYNSAAQDFDGALGRGWSPNVAMRLDQTTQPFQGLGEDYLKSYVQKVNAVTPADVTKMTAQYIKPDQMTIVVVGDKATVAEQVAPYGAGAKQ